MSDIYKPETFKEKALMVIGAHIIKWLSDGIGYTLRMKVFHNKEQWQEYHRHRKPALYAMWHNTVFYTAFFFKRFMLRKGMPVSATVSASKDGELVARVFDYWGTPSVRGSSSKGGREAVATVIRFVKKEGRSITITPDGPRGPVYEFKPGAIVLSQLTGVPLIPVSFAVDKYWVLNSWDRFIIPKPFSRIAIYLGQPVEIPRKLTEEELEEYRKKFEDTMMHEQKLAYEMLSKVTGKKYDPATVEGLGIPRIKKD